MIEAYPLNWPENKRRTFCHEQSRFGSRSIGDASKILAREVSLLGGSNMVISTNLRYRVDGMPYANQRQPNDQGVAVYFNLKQKPMCFACDRWDKIQDNIYAAAKTIEALRGIERWGSGSMVEQAFTGFMALPVPKTPHDVLGVSAGATDAEIDAAYRQKAKIAHPDNGGSAGAMQELNEARAKMKGAMA